MSFERKVSRVGTGTQCRLFVGTQVLAIRRFQMTVTMSSIAGAMTLDNSQTAANEIGDSWCRSSFLLPRSRLSKNSGIEWNHD